MTVILALGVAVLFGSGAYLMLKQDLIRVVAGMVLISNAANLFIMSAGLSRGQPPILPLVEGETTSDPLVQAMTLTAIVISFGVSALLMSIVYRVYMTHRSVDIEVLAEAEERRTELDEATALTTAESIDDPGPEPERELVPAAPTAHAPATQERSAVRRERR